MGDPRHDDGFATGEGGRDGLGSIRRTIHHHPRAAHGQVPVSALRSSIANQLAVAEVVLLAVLTLAALWVVTRSIGYADQSRTGWPPLLIDLLPSLVSLRTALISVAIVGVYFALRLAGRRRIAFWAFTALLVCTHVPDLWVHYRLDWHGFFGRELYFSEPLSLYTSAALSLLTLAGLVAVHRISQLRQLAGDMNRRSVNSMERDAVIRNEAISLALVAALALVLASVAAAVRALAWPGRDAHRPRALDGRNRRGGRDAAAGGIPAFPLSGAQRRRAGAFVERGRCWSFT